MSDVKVTLTGDASGATQAFSQASHGIEEIAGSMGKALGIATLMEKGFESLKETIVDGIKESIEAFAKEEVILKQLSHTAGENAGAFRKMAEAFKEHLGVSDEMVMKMTTLASSFHVLPSLIEPATAAILDWSAITGKDAEGGMQSLIRAVDFGQGKIKSLGIEFTVTGDKATDMKNAIEALNNKFGGGAEAIADSMSGRMHKATEATDDLKKAFGGLFDIVDRRLHILEAAKMAFKGWTLQVKSFMGGGDEEDDDEVVDPSKAAKITHGPRTEEQAGMKFLGAGVGSQGERMLEFKRAQAEKMKALDKELAKNLASERQKLNEDDESKLEEHATQMALAEVTRMQEGQKAEMAELDKEAKEKSKIEQDQWEAEYKIHQKEEAEALAQQKKLGDAMKKNAKELQQDMQKAGLEIGRSLISAISSSLVEAMQGQEVDVLGVVADTAFSIAGIIASVVGDIYGGPAAGQLAGSAVAGIGAIAHQARSSAWQSELKQRHHDGAWIEPPRYFHSGGMAGDETSAILQSGERVLSRLEVARSGGPGEVDRMARGGRGGGNTYNINAFDAKSLVEMFEGRAGRAVYVAAQTGRGDVAGLLGSHG